MLTKLIKHEFRATARIFTPLFGVVLVLSGLSWLVTRLGGILVLSGGTGTGGPVFGVIAGILVLFAVLSLFALMVSAVVITIQRFYKNLLGDEGYLMFTLPVTPGQHILAKLAVGVAWSAAALALVFVTLFAMVTAIPGGPTVSELAALIFEVAAVPAGVLFSRFIPVFLIGLSNSYLLAYLSMAIGSQRSGARLFASFAAYAILNAALMVLYVAAMFVLAGVVSALGLEAELVRFIDGLPPVQSLSIVQGASACVMLIGDVVYFFATRAILTKRLNLA